MKIWVNGTFDVLHIGHVRLLQYASSLGTLRVGLDTDARVKELKGDLRPFNCLADRIEFIQSIKGVTEVVSFSSDEELIYQMKEYSPDIMVIGGDYRGKSIIGQEFVNKIVYFDRIDNYSTSNILSYENSSNR